MYMYIYMSVPLCTIMVLQSVTRVCIGVSTCVQICQCMCECVQVCVYPCACRCAYRCATVNYGCVDDSVWQFMFGCVDDDVRCCGRYGIGNGGVGIPQGGDQVHRWGSVTIGEEPIYTFTSVKGCNDRLRHSFSWWALRGHRWVLISKWTEGEAFQNWKHQEEGGRLGYTMNLYFYSIV